MKVIKKYKRPGCQKLSSSIIEALEGIIVDLKAQMEVLVLDRNEDALCDLCQRGIAENHATAVEIQQQPPRPTSPGSVDKIMADERADDAIGVAVPAVNDLPGSRPN